MAVQTRTVQLDDGWIGQCADPCGFSSRGWATEEIAQSRMAQHRQEHETGVPMSDLNTFRAEHNLIVNSAGEAVFADLGE